MHLLLQIINRSRQAGEADGRPKEASEVLSAALDGCLVLTKCINTEIVKVDKTAAATSSGNFMISDVLAGAEIQTLYLMGVGVHCMGTKKKIDNLQQQELQEGLRAVPQAFKDLLHDLQLGSISSHAIRLQQQLQLPKWQHCQLLKVSMPLMRLLKDSVLCSIEILRHPGQSVEAAAAKKAAVMAYDAMLSVWAAQLSELTDLAEAAAPCSSSSGSSSKSSRQQLICSIASLEECMRSAAGSSVGGQMLMQRAFHIIKLITACKQQLLDASTALEKGARSLLLTCAKLATPTSASSRFMHWCYHV